MILGKLLSFSVLECLTFKMRYCYLSYKVRRNLLVTVYEAAIEVRNVK